MPNPKPFLFVLLCACAWAESPAGPLLEPGEGLALAGPDGVAHLYGDASRESPMGSLAKLVWLKLEGAQWGAASVQFKCAGSWSGLSCWAPKGHGRVDLGRALDQNCHLAFLAWARYSAAGWQRDYGDGAARARLEDVFGPFVGGRMPQGEGLPVLDGPWIGEGDLLRTSPAAMVSWLVEPAQEETVRRARRLLVNALVEFYRLEPGWWIQAGTAPVPSEPGATCAWAVGGNGALTAVLRLPKGTDRAQGLARFRAILLPPARK